MIGKINSLESMGLVDGPGVRYVVFMQGCPLRCIFCHNPETWNINGNASSYTPEKLVKKILNYKSYFDKDGGVTFSGGEPLMQKDFLLKCLKLLKKEGINTCIDTSGFIPDCEEVLKYTDLVLLDIKGTNNDNYKRITGFDIKNVEQFIKLCNKMNKKLWLRMVIIPGINDTDNYIKELIEYVKPIKNVEKIEFLPYHSYAVDKYKELNIKYKLNGVKDMDKDMCKKLEEKLKKGLN